MIYKLEYRENIILKGQTWKTENDCDTSFYV